MERERLGSRLGFILLSAGCAIGIGNVWKFPYITGQYGGAIFVLIYLFFLIILGIPVMTMEFSIGRAARKSPVRIYDKLAKKGSLWFIQGYAAMAGNIILMMFYTTVSGWMLKYFVDTATGKFSGQNTEQIANLFGDMLTDPIQMGIYMLIIVVMGFGICSFGLQKGLEKVTKVMMIALLLIMIVLAVNSVFLPGAKEGLKFFLVPDINKVKEQGLSKVIVAAMNQSFFSLSLGIGAMAIFGSYIGNSHALMGEAVNVAFLDTFVAVTSGLIVLPACFAYGVEPAAGPSLIFITLPNIFNNMPLGRLWGSLFFIFMTFAAFSTVLAVFENIIGMTQDLFHFSRKKACIILCIVISLLSLPCVLGYNVWSSFEPLGTGSTVLDLEDFIVSNFLLPLGSLVYVLFCGTRYGWGFDNFVKEADKGEGLKVPKWAKLYMIYGLPVIVLIVFIMGLV
jgi:transporter